MAYKNIQLAKNHMNFSWIDRLHKITKEIKIILFTTPHYISLHFQNLAVLHFTLMNRIFHFPSLLTLVQFRLHFRNVIIYILQCVSTTEFKLSLKYNNILSVFPYEFNIKASVIQQEKSVHIQNTVNSVADSYCFTFIFTKIRKRIKSLLYVWNWHSSYLII